MSHYKNISGK